MNSLHRLHAVALAVTLLLLSSGVGQAAGDIVPYSGQPAQSAGPIATLVEPPTCDAGNYGLAAFLIQDWTQIGDRYRYYFTGDDGCGMCSIGFQPGALGFTAQLLYPGTYTFELLFAEALPPSETECAVVGNPVCTSGEFDIFVNPGGLYEISVPVDCPCALGGIEDYYVELRVVGFVPAGPSGFELRLALDDTPIPCSSFQVLAQDIGVDLGTVLGAALPGKLLFWANSSCCELPIPIEEQSWGAWKSRF